jgi:hypothetical protein
MGTNVELRLDERGADAARADALHRQLRDELRHVDGLDIEERVSWPAAPEGTRGLDAATVGTLSVAVLGSGGLTALVASLRSWLGREHDSAPRTVRLEVDGDVLELTGATPIEQDRVIALFLSRHEARESP